MSNLVDMTTKIPLFIKVVFLYLMSALLVLGYSSAQQTLADAERQQIDAQLSQQEIANIDIESYRRISGQPVRLEIPSVGIDIAVVGGGYTANGWILSDNLVHFADMTTEPNNQDGRSVLYGHNQWGVLAATRAISVGDELIVTLETGEKLRYVYYQDEETIPSDTAILRAESEESELSLITCSGSWSEKRRIMNFKFYEVMP